MKVVIIDVLPGILYLLGAILLVVLIILVVKLIKTVTKVNKVASEVEAKVDSLNGLFNVIDNATDKLSFLSDRFVDIIAGFFTNWFKRLKRKNKEEKEEEEDE
jgi:hypothetical protein